MGNIKIFVLVLILLIFGCNQKTDKSKDSGNNESEVVESAILVDDLVMDPEAYVGKVIEIEGLVHMSANIQVKGCISPPQLPMI